VNADFFWGEKLGFYVAFCARAGAFLGKEQAFELYKGRPHGRSFFAESVI
jgi:hypothetical protein